MNRTTLVMGASVKPERYSNMAIRRLRAHGHDVVAVGLRAAEVADVSISTELPSGPIDTVTMYLNADNQRKWEDALLGLRPRRIIFNPGAENPVFASRASQAGVEVVEACTLVMLGTGQYGSK
jgi:predicted CoA-binding protein